MKKPMIVALIKNIKRTISMSHTTSIFFTCAHQKVSIKYPCYYHLCFGVQSRVTGKWVGDKVFDYIKKVPS